MDYVELGPVPSEENCAQAGDEGFDRQNKLECMRYMKGLVWKFPNCKFKIKSFKHEFGSYSEVVALYNSEDPDSIEAAYEVQNNLPSTWSELEN